MIFMVKGGATHVIAVATEELAARLFQCGYERASISYFSAVRDFPDWVAQAAEADPAPTENPAPMQVDVPNLIPGIEKRKDSPSAAEQVIQQFDVLPIDHSNQCVCVWGGEGLLPP